jgi:AcrR family transcriptional regulator
MARSADRTRMKLLAAATAEFAEYGISGARIDRIAERAEVNKRMIYAYYGNKEQLFERVVEESLDELLDAIPIQPDNLPEYAGQLFDYLVAHPERRRLSLWRLLERPAQTPSELRSHQTKHDALTRARAHDTDLDARSLLVFIMALVQAWPNTVGAPTAPSRQDLAAQRASVVEAVSRLATPVRTSLESREQ